MKKSIHHSILFFCGVIPLFIGLITLLGWFFHIDALIQISPKFAPMQVNTAICFVFTGLSCIFLGVERDGLRRFCALIPLIFGSLTLGEYVSEQSFHIDEIFGRAYLITNTSHPGRMAPNTAICFVFLGLALSLIKTKGMSCGRHLMLSLFVSLAASISLASVLGYAFSLPLTYTWLQFTGMALHTGFCFMLVGLVLSYFLWKVSRAAAAAAAAAAAIILTVSLILWQALVSAEWSREKEAVTLRAEMVKMEVVDHIQTRLQALERLAVRVSRGYKKEWWIEDAEFNIRDFHGFQAISFIDVSQHVRWLYPEKGNEKVLNYYLGGESQRRLTLDRAKRDRRTAISPPLDLIQTGRGFVAYVPILSLGRLTGYIGGVFRYESLLGALSITEKLAGGGISIYVGNERVYDNQSSQISNADLIAEATLKLDEGTLWRIEVRPPPQKYPFLRHVMPGITLMVGFVLALVVGALVFLWLGSSNQAKELVHQRLALEKERLNAQEKAVFLDAVLQNIPNMVFVKRASDLSFVQLNRAGEDLLGMTSKDLVGKNDYDFFPKAQADFFVSKDREVLAGEVIADIAEEVIETKNGLKYLHTKKVPIRIFEQGGSSDYLLGISEDITAEREVQRRLAEQTQLFQSVVENLTEGLAVFSPDGTALIFNPLAQEITGIVKPDGNPLQWVQQFGVKLPDGSRDYQAEELPAVRAMRGEKVTDVELFLSKEHRFISCNANAVKDPDGKVLFGIVSFRDVTEKKRADQKFELALEAAPTAMILIDRKGKITLVNRQVERLFGYTKEEIVGKPIELLVPERFRAEHPARRRGFTENPQPRPMGAGRDLFGLKKDGREVPIEIGLTPVDTPDGVFVMSSISDITERKHAEVALAKQRLELERSNSDLEQFAYVASHDLQEPLRAVTNNCQALADKYSNLISPHDLEYIELAVNGAKRMRLLIEGLLEYSRLNLGTAPLEPFDPAEVVSEISKSISSRGDSPQVKLTYDPLPSLQGNRLLFGQVIQNLVGNALKFHGEEAIRIHIGVKQSTNGIPTFYVKDNGIGIEPKYFDRIFVLYQRLHGRSKYPGTGLGLALCKKIIERFGGRIWVESVPGKGATFFFTMFQECEPEVTLQEAA